MRSLSILGGLEPSLSFYPMQQTSCGAICISERTRSDLENSCCFNILVLLIQHWLDCTLEEIHAGCVKSVPLLTGAPGYAREAGAVGCAGADAGRALTLRVPPGAAAGVRFVFPGQVGPRVRRQFAQPMKSVRFAPASLHSSPQCPAPGQSGLILIQAGYALPVCLGSPCRSGILN